MNESMEEAMIRFATNGKPIRKPDEIPEKWKAKIHYDPPKENWGQTAKNIRWALAYDRADRLEGKLLSIRDLLLSFAGSEAVLLSEDDYTDDILTYGQLWNGWSHFRYGRNLGGSSDERTAYAYYENRNNPDLAIATGYALFSNGWWRQHSWLVLRKTNCTQIIETKDRNLLYFGAVLVGDSLANFLQRNY